jgi:hypothetical protein
MINFQNGDNILFCRQTPESGGFLREVRYTQTRSPIHVPVGDFNFVEPDASCIPFDFAADHVECCRFSCAIGTQKTNNLTLPKFQTNIMDDFPFFELLA